MSKLNLKDIQTGKKKLTWANVEKYNVLSRAKIDIANHKAKRKVIVGAKGTGKSIIPIIKSLVMFNADPYFNAFGFRKYKDQSINQMSKLFYSGYSLLNIMDFEFQEEYELKKQMGAMYKIKDKRNMLKNQAFQFGSLEDVSGSTDGGGPSNGGYYGVISVDEPVVEKDASNPDKIPTKAEFERSDKIMMDNLERFNDNFESAVGREVETEIYYTMNNWGDHPLTVEADAVLPEDEFLQFVFGMNVFSLFGDEEETIAWFDNEENIQQLLTHNTMSRYKPSNDTLFTRMTKFANPNNHMAKNKKKIINDLKSAIIDSNINWLTILLGMKAVPEIKNEMLVYPQTVYPQIRYNTLDELIDEGYKVTSLNYAWDIDTSRVLTLTPTFQLEIQETILDKPIKKVFIDRQIELIADGTGDIGEMNDVYVNMMKQIMEKHFDKLNFNKAEKFKWKKTLTVDDDRKIYLNELYKKQIPFINAYKMAEKHGIFDIGMRQDMMVTGLETQTIILHPKNKALVADMKVCIKRDVKDNRRKTSGNTNYLDRIDSSEYGVQVFAATIWKNKRSQYDIKRNSN